MKVLAITILLFLSSVTNLLAQDAVFPDKLDVQFYFFEGPINDTNQLMLTIQFRNAGKSIAYIDSALNLGIRHDPYYGNIYFEFQKLEEGKYRPYADLHIDYFYVEDMPEIKRPYRLLKPGDTDTLKYNLFWRTHSVSKGKYKMRAYILKAPINNPPKYYMDYISSQWFSYEILRDMYIKRNDDGTIMQ